MIIKKLSLNDTHAQCFQKLQEQTDESIAQRRKEMRECNHLFVLLDQRMCDDSNDSFRTIECVRCGLTNKFIEMEEHVLFEYVLYKVGLYANNLKTVESTIFLEQFSDAYQKGTEYFNVLPINLLSDEVLPTYHPNLLYKLAITINSNPSSYEEIFVIMKTLHSLETSHERLRLQKIEEAGELLERYHEYQTTKPLTLVKFIQNN